MPWISPISIGGYHLFDFKFGCVLILISLRSIKLLICFLGGIKRVIKHIIGTRFGTCTLKTDCVIISCSEVIFLIKTKQFLCLCFFYYGFSPIRLNITRSKNLTLPVLFTSSGTARKINLLSIVVLSFHFLLSFF